MDPTSPHDESPSGSTHEAIIRGDLATDSDWGAVRLYQGSFLGDDSCSGELITNQWVLSAKHCFAGKAPSSIGVVMGIQWAYPIQRVDHPTLDVSLFKLSAPFLMNLSPWGFRRNVSAQPASAYVGGDIFCMGFGRYDYSQPIDGQFRSAKMPVVRTENAGQSLIMYPNAPTNPQRPWEGDSGGMCVGWDSTIVGVMSGHTSPLSPEQYNVAVNGSSFKDWLDATVQN